MSETATSNISTIKEHLWSVYHSGFYAISGAGAKGEYHRDLFDVGVALTNEDYDQAGELAMNLGRKIGEHGPVAYWMAECDRLMLNLGRLIRLYKPSPSYLN